MIVNLFLTVVVSFYMLIDGKRIFRFLCRLGSRVSNRSKRTTRAGLQTAFSRYVRGQALLGADRRARRGLAIWILSWDVVGVWPEGGQYALLFGFWAGVTEVIPYIGPFLGAVPPVIAAFFHSPITAVWIIIVFFVIQQLESHILAPNIVGSSVGVHPLVVIFALACRGSDRRDPRDDRVAPAPGHAQAHAHLLRFPDVPGSLGWRRRHRSHPGAVGRAAAPAGQTPER